MTSAILLFLFIALLFYLVFGGADFGAGMVESTLGKSSVDLRARQLISRAIAPVWEANHVWLVLLVVIVFMGFPTVYTTVSIYLHLPVIALLMGIVLRGCAFTFRHYDQLDDRFFEFYGAVFRLSSYWAPFFLGVIASALPTGAIQPEEERFWAVYVAPWLTLHGFATGAFVCSLCGFVASVFLVGESNEADIRHLFSRRALGFLAVMVGLGGVTFLTAWLSGFPLPTEFMNSLFSVASFVLATVLLVPFVRTLQGQQPKRARPWAVGIVGAILVGWCGAFFPVAVRLGNGQTLDWYSTAAPPPVQMALLVALLVGSLLIFPALVFLMRTFKS